MKYQYAEMVLGIYTFEQCESSVSICRGPQSGTFVLFPSSINRISKFQTLYRSGVSLVFAPPMIEFPFPLARPSGELLQFGDI